MEDLPVLDFKIKSVIHDYEVNFIDNAAHTLKTEIVDGDVLLIDKNIKSFYPEIINVIPNYVQLIDIDAHEKQKSYEGICFYRRKRKNQCKKYFANGRRDRKSARLFQQRK